jgi:hypothetical protein
VALRQPCLAGSAFARRLILFAWRLISHFPALLSQRQR